MKKISIFILLACFILNTPAFADLSQTDLDKLDEMFRASEARMREYIDLKIDTVRAEIKTLDAKLTGEIKALDKKFTGEIKTVKEEIRTVREEIKGVKSSMSIIFGFVIALVALVALITIAVGVPQFLLACRDKGSKSRDDQIQELRREIELLKQQRISGS